MPGEGPAMAIPFVFLLLLFLAPSSAEIRFARIRSDSRPVISLNEFGFTDFGGLEFNVTSLSFSNPSAADVSKLGFFLTDRNSWLKVVRQLENSDIACPIDSNLLRTVFPLSSLREDTFSAVFSHPGAGQYSLAFANCIPGLRVSMDVSSAMYNIRSETGGRDYLSSGTTLLPRVYSFFSLIYFSIVVYWSSILYKKRQSASAIHLIVFGLLILKAMSLLSDAEEASAINTTGRVHLQNSRLFLKFVTNMIFPRPVVASFAGVPIDETGPKNLVVWEVGFLLGEAVLFCFVLIVMDLMKLKSVRNWCAFGFCYLYFTSVVVYVLELSSSYRYLWASVVAAELISLVFYVLIGYKIRGYFADEVEEVVVAEQLKLKPFSK